MMTKAQYQAQAQAAATAAAQAAMDAKIEDIINSALNAAATHGDGTGVEVAFPYSWDVSRVMAAVAAAGFTVSGGDVFTDSHNLQYRCYVLS